MAAHKCHNFARAVTQGGNVHSVDGIRHLSEHIDGLVNTRRSETGGGLIHSLQTVN